MALPPSEHQHCTDEAQKDETVLSIYIYIYIYIYMYIYINICISSESPINGSRFQFLRCLLRKKY